MSVRIQKLHAREILDSRGYPTIEVEIQIFRAQDGRNREGFGRAAVPSGASTGEGEALELRDETPSRYLGKGVLKAVENVRMNIASAARDREFLSQSHFDEFLRTLDGTENKSKLGANAILGASMAFARAMADLEGVTLSDFLAKEFQKDAPGGTLLPTPLMNILNGGKHADNGLAIQEFMIVPRGFDSFHESLRAGVEVFHHLKKILTAMKLSTSVGDEGGFAPQVGAGLGEEPHTAVLSLLMEAIQRAGYEPGTQIALALDCAASEFADVTNGDTAGATEREYVYRFEGKKLTTQQMTQVYAKWLDQYPVISIEDGLAEGDWEGWSQMTQLLGGRCQLVGDDLFCTNPKTLQRGIDEGASNAILIKLNQIGTLTETLDCMRLARKAGLRAIVSHRSGETEDTFIAELAVGTSCGQIKTGSASRTDRLAKYNELLRIEERLGKRAKFGLISS